MTTTAVRVLVVADTHLGAGQGHRLTERLSRSLARADAILHAGDIVDASVLLALAEHAPVHAVLGNNDHGLELPVQLTLSLGGCEVAMIHDSGPATGRGNRLHRWFPTADVVVFGHSHIPWSQTHVADDHRIQRHLNPGSAIQRRRQPRCTAAWLELRGGQVVDVRHIAVPEHDAAPTLHEILDSR